MTDGLCQVVRESLETMMMMGLMIQLLPCGTKCHPRSSSNIQRLFVLCFSFLGTFWDQRGLWKKHAAGHPIQELFQCSFIGLRHCFYVLSYMVWNDQKFKFWLGLFVFLGPNTIDHYFFYHLALWWLWCSGSCLAPRQSPASWPQRASTWTAGSQVLIFLMQPWPVSAALFVEGNLSFTCTLYFWTFVLGCGAQCFVVCFVTSDKIPFFLWAAPLQGMGKNLSSFLVELVMCPEPPAGY